MTLIIDSGPLIALADRNDPARTAVAQLLDAEPGSLVVPMPVATEVDHILGRRGGRVSRLAFLEDIATGRFVVECLTEPEWTTLLALEYRYADLDAGLADLAVVVLADRFNCHRIATFDQRDFRVLRPLRGAAAFELVPTLAA